VADDALDRDDQEVANRDEQQSVAVKIEMTAERIRMRTP
jgi:hypothetical protein